MAERLSRDPFWGHIEEGGEKAIGCYGKWYRSFEDFCQKAETGNEKFTSIYDEFYDVEVA